MSFAQIFWELNNLTSIGGVTPSIDGNPELISIVSGSAIQFDGLEDRLEIDSNPLIGLSEFTIEAVFRVDAGGDAEQKIIHIQADQDIRILYEVEFTSSNEWFLENYIQVGELEEQKLWLADTFKVHPANAWYHAAITYKDGEFVQYINGIEENKGSMDWIAPTDGVVSLGARLTKTGYMTGAIKKLVFSDRALSPVEFSMENELIDDPKLLLFESLDSIGGYGLEVFGNPTIIETELGKAIEFDGTEDGIYILGNPLLGTEEFTIESIIKPYASYPDNVEPRYLHFQDPNVDSKRITMEYRLTNNNDWYFDGFIKSTVNNKALIDDSYTHDTEEWMHVAITYKDGVFKTYVNGKEELSGEVTYEALPETAIISAGMRMNKVNYMQGAIHSVRISRSLLSPESFIMMEAYDTTTSTQNPTHTSQKIFQPQELRVKITGSLSSGLEIVPHLENPRQIHLNISNIKGQMVHCQSTYISGTNTIHIETSNWNPGIYVIHLSAGKQVFSKMLPLY